MNTRENDGPMGIRSAHSNGMWSTTFPCAPIIAATFNTDLIRRVGDGKGEDILHSGHRVLYTVLHSNAMNGVTSNIEIHKIVTWWQHLITVLIVVLAVLTAVFVGLTASVRRAADTPFAEDRKLTPRYGRLRPQISFPKGNGGKLLTSLPPFPYFYSRTLLLIST